MNKFESEIYRDLEGLEIPVEAQYVITDTRVDYPFRIDFALGHPEAPSLIVLAVEADGATYHSGLGERDYDEYRQRRLEEIGFRFHRIWSTDWWDDSETEVMYLEEAYWDAVRRADELSNAQWRLL